MKAGKKPFNAMLIGIGMFFLIDLNVNTVDYLPDFIALVLISAGLGTVFYFSEDLAKAKKYIRCFFILAAAGRQSNLKRERAMN